MPTTTEFHSIHEAAKPAGKRVHHNSLACPSALEIPGHERKSGTGDYRLCKHCEKHAAAAFHSVHEAAKPAGKRVHHNHKSCPSGKEIPANERVSGTGGYRLCKHCEQRHVGHIAFHSIHEAVKPAGKRVHHNHETCLAGKEIPAKERVSGSGGYRLCKICAQHHKETAKAEAIGFYSKHEAEKPAGKRVHHNHKACLAGREIPVKERVNGTGGYRLCKMCEEHRAAAKKK